jgi:hypothetical protein
LAPPSPNDPFFALESQIRECYGRAAYTHGTHINTARDLLWRQSVAKWANIIISALITGGAIKTVATPEATWAPIATMVLSILSLILNAYLKDLDPGGLAQRHRDASQDVWNIRERYLSLITDIIARTSPIDELLRRRDELQSQLHKIYRGSPTTSNRAYAKTQDDLKKREALTFTEEELDNILPPALRRSERRTLP